MAFNDTLTAQCDGTNTVFVTSVFPVVRPRQAYDLKGSPVGSVLNPLTITYDGAARAEYALPADGSALAAGIYYVMDWNLGEFRLVDQTGAVVTPAAAKVLTVAGFRATNRAVWSVDAVGGENIKDRYDRLLTEIGNRKVVIENDRYYTANFVLMSGALDNALTQAESFRATGQRVATGLAADGSVGFTKGVPTFNPSAPGLVMGDIRSAHTHKHHTVSLPQRKPRHAWAVSRHPATCNKNGQTRTGAPLRTLSKSEVQAHGLPLARGARHA